MDVPPGLVGSGGGGGPRVGGAVGSVPAPGMAGNRGRVQAAVDPFLVRRPCASMVFTGSCWASNVTRAHIAEVCEG